MAWHYLSYVLREKCSEASVASYWDHFDLMWVTPIPRSRSYDWDQLQNLLFLLDNPDKIGRDIETNSETVLLYAKELNLVKS